MILKSRCRFSGIFFFGAHFMDGTIWLAGTSGHEVRITLYPNVSSCSLRTKHNFSLRIFFTMWTLSIFSEDVVNYDTRLGVESQR